MSVESWTANEIVGSLVVAAYDKPPVSKPCESAEGVGRGQLTGCAWGGFDRFQNLASVKWKEEKGYILSGGAGEIRGDHQ